jgi:hypothetical protein
MTSITTHIISVALATFALVAPAAVAQPIRDSGEIRTSRLASTSTPRQDLRNPDNRLVEAALAQERYLGSYGGGVGGPAQDRRSPDVRNPDDRLVEAALAQERYLGSYGSGIGGPAQHLRSPDVRDAPAVRASLDAPEAISPRVFTDRQRAIVERFKRSPSFQEALRGAARVAKLPLRAPVGSDDGIDWGDAGIGAGSLLGVIALGVAGAITILHRRRRARGAATVA